MSSNPFSLTEPLSGSMNPVSRLNTVVLPAPLGPTRAVIVPLRSVMLSSSAATMPPKRLDRLRTSSTTGASSQSRSRATSGSTLPPTEVVAPTPTTVVLCSR